MKQFKKDIERYRAAFKVWAFKIAPVIAKETDPKVIEKIIRKGIRELWKNL